MQTRDLVMDEPTTIDDWMAKSVTFTTVRPLDSSAIPDDPAEGVALQGGVKVKGHPGLKAKARLTTAPLASRDLGRLTLPAILGDDPGVSQPFILAPTRATDQGLSVLELTDVEPNSEDLVTADQPLRVDIPQKLGDGEYLLPIGFDGEFFLPLGKALELPDGTTEVVLDRIPAPTVTGGTRSLTGSIRIFFQKIDQQDTRHDLPLPAPRRGRRRRRRVARLRTRPGEGARPRRATAKTILLFVHGIIGDTREHGQERPAGQGRRRAAALEEPVRPGPDLRLREPEHAHRGHRPLAQAAARGRRARGRATARRCTSRRTRWGAWSRAGSSSTREATRSSEAGDAGHAQRRIALAAAWSTGPPRRSPWGSTSSPSSPGPARSWPGSPRAIDQLKVDLTQMHAGSPVLKLLAQSPDPKVPYIMVAGNTSLPPQVTTPDPAKGNTSILNRLLGRLRAVKPLEIAANQLFGGTANDVAVSLQSMRTVPRPTRRRTTCARSTATT